MRKLDNQNPAVHGGSINESIQNLIIAGDAPCVLTDIAAVPRVCSYDFMEIGPNAMEKYPMPVKYVATFHPRDIPEIRRRRETIGGNLDYKVISIEIEIDGKKQKRDDVDIVIDGWWKPSGSSALLGVQAALGMGYERIILCGCPLVGKDNTINHNDYMMYHIGWEARVAELAGRVRSMSGWTREFLGAPTEEWLLSREGEAVNG